MTDRYPVSHGATPEAFDIEGGWYHVINRGLERQRIFTEERTNLHFLGILSILPVRLGLKIHGWPEYFDHRDAISDNQIESGRGRME